MSQLGTPLADFDLISEFDNWTEARLFQTLGGRANASFRGGNGGHSGGAMQPIFHVNIPDVPRPTIDQMELAFHWGADAHKHETEKTILTDTKFTDTQMTHLLAFCGLKEDETDLLPEIWIKIQTTKDWYTAGVELTKWFRSHQSEDDVEVQFHKELVDDIRKLQFSMGPLPLVDNAYRGITPLAFVLLTVGEEHKLREEQEAFDGATLLTPAMMRANKRKCPAIPTTFDQLVRLLVWYIRVGLWLFGPHCQHFIEVKMVKQELMRMYCRNAGQLPAGTITGIMWDIVVNAAQFFYTFPSDANFTANPQRNIPVSTLSIKRSLLSANLHIAALDTPKRWLPPLVPYTPSPGGNNALEHTRQQ